MRLIFCTLVLTCCISAFARTRAPKIELSAPLANKLEDILGRADELRKALVQKQETLTTTRILELNRALVEAMRMHDPDKRNKEHLDRILNEAQKELEQVKTLRGESRKASLQNAFKQIVLIGQNYKLTGDYKFYFCGKDRSIWPQKESKPQNPINPETFLNCGIRVE
jgi:hypothetical protein